MAERKQGVHKTEAEKAAELLEKQTATVARLEEKEGVLEQQLADVVHQLGQERDLLAYYEKHPLLMTINEKDHEELPLEFLPKSWKGFPGKHVDA